MSNDLPALIPASLILSTGEIFKGLAPQRQKPVQLGELVFNTGMVGYVESLTDPSYSGQLLTFTYPLMGNYGVPDSSQWESYKAHASGMIVSSLSPIFTRSFAQQSLLDFCQSQGLAVLLDVDTRALTKCVRDKGVVPAAIVLGDERPLQFSDINETHLVEQVSPKTITTEGSGDYTVIVIDCGMKNSIWKHLLKFPLKLKRVPFNYDFTHEHFDGVLISNGPGDPVRCQETIQIIQKALKKEKPIFGICLGAQLLGLSIGAKTYKLRFGHRSQNQPCQKEGSRRCYLTSQNHGYAIDENTLPLGWKVTYRNLNDQTVQGIAHEKLPFSAVQFHPEAAPGPSDTTFLFDDFFHLVKEYA